MTQNAGRLKEAYAGVQCGWGRIFLCPLSGLGFMRVPVLTARRTSDVPKA